MKTKNQVVLKALSYLGSTYHSIDIDTETSSHVKIVNVHFQDALDELLERYGWEDYLAEETLYKYATDPTNNWGYGYTYTSKVQIIRSMGVDGRFHKVEDINENSKLRFQRVGSVTFASWATATGYEVEDLVRVAGQNYRCLIANPSSSALFATDLAAAEWVAIGGAIYSDIDDADIEFTHRVLLSDDPYFENHFADGLAGMLAMKIGPGIVSNFAIVQEKFEEKFDRVISNAIALDLSRKPRKREAEPRFVQARRG